MSFIFFCRASVTQAQRQPQVAREEYGHVVDDHWKSVVKTAVKKVKQQKKLVIALVTSRL